MKYTGPTYRPPGEANTLLLQVTVGCAHNQCTFCTMYQDTPFSIENIDQIEKDLLEAKSRDASIERIFLVNGDAFVLSTRRLLEVTNKIIEIFPEIKTISMYASIRNMMDKSLEDLIQLRNNRINELSVGLETGHQESLAYMNKGYQLKDTYEQLGKLNQANIKFRAIFMLGVAGQGKGIENAHATAKLINTVQPEHVAFTTLGIFPGSQLASDVAKGNFIQATELENLQEEKTIIELLELQNTPFFANHPTNAAAISGRLPRDKEKFIKEIEETIDCIDDDFLHSAFKRFSL